MRYEYIRIFVFNIHSSMPKCINLGKEQINTLHFYCSMNAKPKILTARRLSYTKHLYLLRYLQYIYKNNFLKFLLYSYCTRILISYRNSIAWRIEFPKYSIIIFVLLLIYFFFVFVFSLTRSSFFVKDIKYYDIITWTEYLMSAYE